MWLWHWAMFPVCLLIIYMYPLDRCLFTCPFLIRLFLFWVFHFIAFCSCFMNKIVFLLSLRDCLVLSFLLLSVLFLLSLSYFFLFVLFYIIGFPQVFRFLFRLKSGKLKCWLAAVWRVGARPGADFFHVGIVCNCQCLCAVPLDAQFPPQESSHLQLRNVSQAVRVWLNWVGKGPYASCWLFPSQAHHTHFCCLLN